MTAKELLQPRFEVIADYPNCKFKIGDVLERIPNATNNWYNADKSLVNGDITLEEIKKYPHLFKKLNWWEKRTLEQMPKRLMSILDDKKGCYNIEEWDMEILVGWINKKEMTCCSLLSFKPEFGYIPVD